MEKEREPGESLGKGVKRKDKDKDKEKAEDNDAAHVRLMSHLLSFISARKALGADGQTILHVDAFACCRAKDIFERYIAGKCYLSSNGTIII